MNVITIQSEVWESLQQKIEAIQAKVEQQQRAAWEEAWIDNETMMQRLKVSRKTAQTYRDSGLISFSQIGNKIYYRNKDVEEFLMRHRISRNGV